MGYIVERKTLKSIIKDLQKQKEKVVFTTGAFDLLHFGQIEFLKKSRGNKILIVGVESDERIAYYKGKKPIIPLIERVKIISSISFVDFVYPITDKEHSQAYYLKLYDELSPSIITYGRNYAAEDKIKEEATYFKNIRFKKVTHRYDKIQSTTKIIDKILSHRGQED